MYVRVLYASTQSVEALSTLFTCRLCRPLNESPPPRSREGAVFALSKHKHDSMLTAVTSILTLYLFPSVRGVRIYSNSEQTTPGLCLVSGWESRATRRRRGEGEMLSLLTYIEVLS